jgi:hypothetical protein
MLEPWCRSKPLQFFCNVRALRAVFCPDRLIVWQSDSEACDTLCSTDAAEASTAGVCLSVATLCATVATVLCVDRARVRKHGCDWTKMEEELSGTKYH